MNGPKGKRGPIASCPMCGEGATGITWDAELDVCTCCNCGWTNGGEILDLYPTAPGPKTPMTNADRIRAMTDEELAAAFADAVYYGPTEKRCNDRNEAIQAWMDWLQQPCGGDDCADRNG